MFNRCDVEITAAKKGRIASTDGFTLVELSIAMAIFSFLLVIATSSLIQIMGMNTAALANRSTQQDARFIIEQIEKQVRLAEEVRVQQGGISPDRDTLCLRSGNEYLQYSLDTDNNMSRYELNNLDQCGAPTSAPNYLNAVPAAGAGNGVRVVRFSVSLPDTAATAAKTVSNGIVGIELTTIGSNIDVATELEPDLQACLPQVGNQFCSVTTLNTAAQLRGGQSRDRLDQ